MKARTRTDRKEKFYCTDERQGVEYKCKDSFWEQCFRKERCRYQLSEYQVSELKPVWVDRTDMGPWATNMNYIIRGM